MRLEITSLLPALLAFGIAGLTARATLRCSAFFAGLLATQSARRYVALDGLRGGLAFAVFLSHGVSVYYLHLVGRWGWPPSPFYTLCGSVPVSLFFMITGFLFWRKVIAASGRLGIKQLYASRLRRLGPMYLACLLLMLVIVGFRTGWVPQVPPRGLLVSIVAWALFGVLGQPDINGFAGTHLIDPALWSLRYEWLFYLNLPLLSLCATPARFWLIPLVGSAAPLMGWNGLLISDFAIGMCAAQFAASREFPGVLRSPIAAVVALVPLAACLLLDDGDFDLPSTLAAALLFVVIIGGNDLFGLLSSRAMRLLGEISYSIYVVHGLVLYLFIGFVNDRIPVASLSPAGYWALLSIAAAMLVVISAITYRWIEHPFLRRGSTATAPSPSEAQHQLI